MIGKVLLTILTAKQLKRNKRNLNFLCFGKYRMNSDIEKNMPGSQNNHYSC